MTSIGLIGCGNIGRKRLENIEPFDKVISVCDIDTTLSTSLANKYNAIACTDYRQITTHKNIDAVIISTTHDMLAKIALSALENNKHVLVEKPGAKNFQEFEEIYNFYNKMNTKPIFKVGFNHRFHQSFIKAKSIVDSGDIGDIMFIRSYYGHGGRLGYEKEWRADIHKSGGGELLDQGSHVIDLSRWFLGDFDKIFGTIKTYFWDTTVEDNAFVILETKHGKISHIQVSWTEWKNTFLFEIYGKKGKLRIEGLGGSYGTERLYHYKMTQELLPPETIIYEYPLQDNSWKLEWKNFKNTIECKESICGGIKDAFENLKIVEEIYKNNA